MSERAHTRGGFCAVCGTDDPAIGSACLVPRLASAAHRLAAGKRRRDVLRFARGVTVDGGLVVEAAHDGVREGQRDVTLTLYVDATVAEREHGGDIIRTGLSNGWGEP